VACRRLKVVGVRRFFFLPRLVACRTRSEEFHSVKKTFTPRASSQRLRS
jgi:hypothetical protein